MRSLLWIRGKDLRIRDHFGLNTVKKDTWVLPVFVLDPFFISAARSKDLPHRIQYLLDSLQALAAAYTQGGSKLYVVPGRSVEVVPRLCQEFGVDRVVASRWSEPIGKRRDQLIYEALQSLGTRLELVGGETLLPPGSVTTEGGTLYKVFTPFARKAFKLLEETPPEVPDQVTLPEAVEVSLQATVPSVENLGIERNEHLLEAGEVSAAGRLSEFFNARLEDYPEARDSLPVAGTSRLSQDFKFGTLAVARAWQEARRIKTKAPSKKESAQKFMTELLWREFAYHWLNERPDLLKSTFNSKYEGFPYQNDPEMIEAWKWGKTGYPVVDASMRQLLKEGYIHNRARMVTASFLTRHLLVDYKVGEAFFMRYLVDGDWAVNNMSWQWAAGSGCDAQPYFRIFNPTSQGKKFDPEGEYVKKYIPELADCPTRWVHEPWKWEERETNGYPAPVVEHREARLRYLALAKDHLKNS